MADLQNILQEKLKSAAQDFQQGRLESAERTFGEILAYAPEDPELLSFLAAIAARKGDDEKAISLLEFALAKNPSNDAIQYNLGTHYMTLKRYAEAEISLQSALATNPNNTSAALNLGNALRGLGKTAAAADAYKLVISQRPDHINARVECVKCLIQTEALDEAAKLLDESLHKFPQESEFQLCEGLLSLKNGDWQAAIKAFDCPLSKTPWHPIAIAFKGVALHEAGLESESNTLIGLEDLVRVTNFSSGFSDDQMAELANALTEHPSMAWERPDTSTSGGGQTGNLIDDTADIIRRFTEALTGFVDSWVSNLAANPDHPFTNSIPKSWRYSIWATVLQSGGRQTSHLHPSGWLSGVFYVAIPGAILNINAGANDGWIEFGAPGYGYDAVLPPKVRLEQPEVDRLILFPSSVFHHTLPFTDTESRISIAFDLIPTDGVS